MFRLIRRHSKFTTLYHFIAYFYLYQNLNSQTYIYFDTFRIIHCALSDYHEKSNDNSMWLIVYVIVRAWIFFFFNFNFGKKCPWIFYYDFVPGLLFYTRSVGDRRQSFRILRSAIYAFHARLISRWVSLSLSLSLHIWHDLTQVLESRIFLQRWIHWFFKKISNCFFT